jgi:outer membrane receptor for monomeric catechols
MLPTSWRHDLALRWRLSRQIELWGGVDNVFDKANEAYVGAPSLGRRARVGLVATL